MTRIFLDVDEPTQDYQGPALFASGHRVFFLFAALSAVVFLDLWLLAYIDYIDLSSAWHGHEMVFGFASAAITGFLMAAVPTWTNSAKFLGTKVIFMAAIWLLGRIAIGLGELDEAYEMVSWLDLLYLPLLAFEIIKRLVGAGNKRNYIVGVILVSLCICNVMWHFGDQGAAVRGGVYVIIAIAALISARVIPAFTQNALRMKLQTEITCSTPQWTHMAAVILVLLTALCTLVSVPEDIAGAIAALTCLLLFYRMLGWHSFRTWDNPIVWVLHAAYVWLPIGFGLKALADFGLWQDANAALHALTTGGIGVLILAVASRAALGHSGRKLEASKTTVCAYILVILAAITRTFALDENWVMLSGTLWVIGFLLFTIVYTPILVKPRIDGLPG
ncbi:NnrS family protein [Terasakiella sp. SH-1]|uniref:NnrS family protein n=1 Tax=Terasakiella sp. SH-1 TaxID=2560057 RepID=UPI00107394AC|nr:NnrS family protein [Terasakiella sp. SH-1]